MPSSTTTNTTRNRRTPPLLAEETDSGITGLGGASAMEPSPLEELIAKSTSEQAEASGSPLFPVQEEEEDVTHDDNQDAISPTMPSSSWITLAAGTLSLLQIGLTWGSFLSSCWFDTHITVTVPWWESGATVTSSSAVDQTIQSTSLADIIQAFLSTGQMGISFCLVVSAVILPCLTMILCPMYIVADFQQRSKRRSPRQEPYSTGHQESSSWPRIGVEVCLRITFLVFFLLCTLDVASSKILLHQHHEDHSSILVSNRTTSGLVGYVMGTSAALIALCLLRYDTPPSLSSSRTLPTIDQQENIQQQLQQPLLQDDRSPTTTLEISDSATTTAGGQQPLSTIQQVIFFEAILLAVILWLPILSLPLFSVTYDGIAAAFIETTFFQVRMIEFPSLLWKSGSLSGTPPWITLSLGIALVLFVYVIPFIATIVVVMAWRHRPSPSTRHISQQHEFKRILRWIQPCLAGGVFACALLISVPALEPIATFLLDSQSGGLCANIKTLVDTPCLSISGDFQLAIWFLLLHSTVLEVMVAVILALN